MPNPDFITALIRGRDGSVFLDRRFHTTHEMLENLTVYLNYLGTIDGTILRSVRVHVSVILIPPGDVEREILMQAMRPALLDKGTRDRATPHF